MWRQAVVVLLVAASAAAHAAPVLSTSDDPHPGIHHEHWVDASIPATLDLVSIDLTSAEIGVYATAGDQRGQTTSAYAAAIDAQVAINGDSFAPAGFVPRGLAWGGSGAWGDTADDAISAVLHFHRAEEATVAGILPPETVSAPGDLPAGTQGVVSGHPLLVRSGAVVSALDCTDPDAIACERAPRSAVALSADGNTMWLVTVDGWQTSSLGMTDAEVATFLHGRGADLAFALDSGASATMVLDGTVVNQPSDGVEREVANHLAIKFGSLPKGQLVGFVCIHDVFGCPDDSSRWIAGATVTLDDGRQLTTPSGEASFYDFSSVTPRLACATVKADGYLTVTQCQQVDSGMQTYNSIAMFEGQDPPDAGAMADAALAADGAVLGSDAQGDAGGNHESGPGGGGCCDAGRDRPAGSSLALFAALGWFLSRRRGTRVRP